MKKDTTMFLDYIDFSEEELKNPPREMTDEEYQKAKIEMKEKTEAIFAKYLK
ncbi:hypothetical protein [Veillonella caviae]|uniref:hypothetical protein n=1 Tax=Veillonella caviae TaxID=248316 RepID=UPI0023F3D560|nr:hypothetical protein [Veillonella caviae]MCI6407665.1 hypothetical protein [Veillonella caviae]MDY6225803.1 hypothetical protein [Veillonella caviae]